MMQGVEAISRDHLANVISISYGSGETTYRYGRDEVTAQDPAELAAAAAGIPVAAATGDCGPVMQAAVATGICTPRTKPEIGTWDDSPWVLAVGGSIPSATGTRAQAANQLAALRRAIHLSPASVTASATTHLTATGFLPTFPVVLSIDGRKVTTLHADRHGDVHDTINTARLHLTARTHTVTLKSMLITETGRLKTT